MKYRVRWMMLAGGKFHTDVEALDPKEARSAEPMASISGASFFAGITSIDAEPFGPCFVEGLEHQCYTCRPNTECVHCMAHSKTAGALSN